MSGTSRKRIPARGLLLIFGVAAGLSYLWFLPGPGGNEGLTGDEAADGYDQGSVTDRTELTEPAPLAATVAAAETVPLTLTAIVYGENGEGSMAMIAAGDGDEQIYRTGQQIAGAADTHLQTIYTDRVVVSRGDRLETLRLTGGRRLQAPPGSFAYQQGIPRLVTGPAGAGSDDSPGDPADVGILRITTPPTGSGRDSPQPVDGDPPVVRIETPESAGENPETQVGDKSGEAEIPRIGQGQVLN